MAGIKAVTVCEQEHRPLKDLHSVFRSLYYGKKYEPLMPIFDPFLDRLNVPDIVALVEKGEISRAYQSIAVRGAAHKIRSFFLRDIAIATTAESEAWTLENHYMYCQPVDLWVRVTMDCLGRICPRRLPELRRYPGLSRADREKAALLIQLAREADVSPLHVNHGVWYFARHAIEDEGRLRTVLEACDVAVMKAELALIEDFADLF